MFDKMSKSKHVFERKRNVCAKTFKVHERSNTSSFPFLFGDQLKKLFFFLREKAFGRYFMYLTKNSKFYQLLFHYVRSWVDKNNYIF